MAEAGRIQESNKQQIIKELMSLRNIGPKMAEKLYQIRIHSVDEVLKHKPEELYERLNEYLGYRIDRCVLYIFRGAKHNLPWPLCSDKNWKDR
ncbi:helix-hairpin-helix domain-containing protein [bacterium]|nr:helix-hairpin-helix domain-containing protein [bacterium]MBU1614431.1 helix-hairpin-helix domain-containing protein [bacterium]